MVLLAAAQHGVPRPRGDPERGQDRAIAGYGAADKEQVQRMVQMVLGMDELPRPDDAADALAIAVWAANTGRFRRRRGHRGRHGSRGRGAHRRAVASRATSAPYRRLWPRSVPGRAPRSATPPRRARPVIASVEGVVGAVAADSLVIEVGGIGYRVFAAPAIITAAVPGGRLKLHTYHLVREDQQALYGFRTAEELGFFNLLLTVNGVGPKVALAIVGSRPTADLQLAIMTADQAVLVAIPGIGKKLAERIIFELKEKVAAAGVAALGPPAPAWRGAAEGEIVAALQALGYSLAEAREASRTALADVGVGSTSRSGSRPRCGASPGLSRARRAQPMRRCLMRRRRWRTAPRRRRGSPRSAASPPGIHATTSGSRC